MNKNTIVFAVAGLLLIGGIGYVVMQSKPTPTDSMSQVGNTTPSPEGAIDESETTAPDGETDLDAETAGTKGVVEVTLEASPFKFSQAEIRVKQGDTVKVTVNNIQGVHDWILEGYDDVGTEQIQEGKSETVEFVADKAGTFEYYCSVGNHRAQGMVGSLIVEE